MRQHVSCVGSILRQHVSCVSTYPALEVSCVSTYPALEVSCVGSILRQHVSCVSTYPALEVSCVSTYPALRAPRLASFGFALTSSDRIYLRSRCEMFRFRPQRFQQLALVSSLRLLINYIASLCWQGNLPPGNPSKPLLASFRGFASAAWGFS
jgi:hypothetical protein